LGQALEKAADLARRPGERQRAWRRRRERAARAIAAAAADEQAAEPIAADVLRQMLDDPPS
jgi:hypothetical protein